MSAGVRTFDMNKLVVGMIALVITFLIFLTVNDPLLALEPPKTGSSATFLTYNNTIYGTSINYLSNWIPQEVGNEILLSILENTTSLGENGKNQNSELANKV
jgi:hypothetical protein